MDWNDLRYFLALCREGTLAGAARALKVRHSTVGRRIGELEAALGVNLFTRSQDGFVLTEAGAEMVRPAEEAERIFDAIARRMAGKDDRLEGVVRLAVSEAFSGFVVRRLAELHARYPGLIVEILSSNTRVDLERGEADLALRIAETTQPDLVCRHAGNANWSLYASENYVKRKGPVASPSDLAGHDVIAFDDTMAGVPGALWINEHAAGANVILRGNSIIAVLNACLIGMGLAVLPCFLADAESHLRRLTGEVLGSREIWLVFHPEIGKIARVRRVIDFVAEIIRDNAPALLGEASTGRQGQDDQTPTQPAREPGEERRQNRRGVNESLGKV
jgi:DNA-binding transcriptional LysR family regulator